jgi:uncharacterized membrane protein
MRKWYPALPILAVFIFSAVVYNDLPERMPTRWSFQGEVIGYGSRFVGAFMLPLIMLGTWIMLRLLPKVDPRRAHYAKFQGTYDLLVALIVTFLAFIHIAVVGKVLGWPIPLSRAVPIGAGMMMIVLGNLLPRARSNWWVGIRTPWTLTSDTVWAKTHRLAGYLFVIGGLIILSGAFLPEYWTPYLVMIGAGGSSIVATGYSYFAWREEKRVQSSP